MYCIDKCAFIVLLLSYAFLHLTVYCSCSILSHFVSVKTLKSQDRGKTDEESVRPSQCRSGIYKVETSQGRRDSYLAKDIASRHALSRVSFMRSRTSLIDTISFHHTGVGVTTGSDEWLLCVGRMRWWWYCSSSSASLIIMCSTTIFLCHCTSSSDLYVSMYGHIFVYTTDLQSVCSLFLCFTHGWCEVVNRQQLYQIM